MGSSTDEDDGVLRPVIVVDVQTWPLIWGPEIEGDGLREGRRGARRCAPLREAGVMDVSDVTRHAAAHDEDWTALYLIRLTTPQPHHIATQELSSTIPGYIEKKNPAYKNFCLLFLEPISDRALSPGISLRLLATLRHARWRNPPVGRNTACQTARLARSPAHRLRTTKNHCGAVNASKMHPVKRRLAANNQFPVINYSRCRLQIFGDSFTSGPSKCALIGTRLSSTPPPAIRDRS